MPDIFGDEWFEDRPVHANPCRTYPRLPPDVTAQGLKWTKRRRLSRLASVKIGHANTTP